MKRQNIPYLILGVPSTATTDDASLGFARASKRIKRMEDAPFSIEDLTAALASVESSAAGSPRFEYCLPADPEVTSGWTDEKAEAARAHEADDRESAATGHVFAAIQHLLEWRWADAESSAKDALRLSKVEATRDEALNALALALAMRDQTDKAISALKQAVEGQWNLALQQNLGILALESDPELAANQATFWLDAAKTPQEREQALLLVLSMWMSLQDEATDDDVETVDLPPRIRAAFRQALASELPEETFRLLGTFLAQNDKEWVLKASNWAGGPLGATLAASMILARAEGFEHFLDFLMDNAKSSSEAVREAINRLVREMNDIMFTEETALGPASVCIQLFDKGLDFSNFERVLARPLTVREICISIGSEQGEPVEKVLDWLIQAKEATARLEASDEAREVLLETIGSAGNLAAAVFHDSRMDDGRKIFETLSEINQAYMSYGGRRRINKASLRDIASDMSKWCADTRRIHSKCMKVATKEDLRKAWHDLMTAVAQLDSNIQRYT